MFQKCLDPFEDVEAEPQQNPIKLPWQSIRKHLLNVFLGSEPTLCRSANILHVLGSMTVRHFFLSLSLFIKASK